MVAEADQKFRIESRSASGAGRSNRYVAAVIIPLDFHRGVASACVRGWAERQSEPRESFQLLIGAPAGFDRGELATIRAMLAPWDVLIEYDRDPEIGLMDALARRAEAGLLVFTEPHCIPLPEALGYLRRLLDEHPEWSGVTAPTKPLVHDLLSRIECEVYESDVNAKLASGGWLRTINQCSLIRWEAYEQVGGFRGRYGHFADWVLAASFAVHGLRLGAADRAVVQHKYIGELAGLEEFTRTFAYGQTQFMNECASLPEARLLPGVPELEEFRCRSAGERRQVFRQVARDTPRAIAAILRGSGRAGVPSIGDHLAWLRRVRASARDHVGSGARLAEQRAVQARQSLVRSLNHSDRAAAKIWLLEWFSALVEQGRYEYLARVNGEVALARPLVATRGAGRWDASGGSEALVLDSYDIEGTDQGPIRWTRPLFQCLLPLGAGRHRVTATWSDHRLLARAELLRVRHRGRPIPVRGIAREATSLTFEIATETAGWQDVTISVLGCRWPGDGRLLGLPLRSIEWSAVSS